MLEQKNIKGNWDLKKQFQENEFVKHDSKKQHETKARTTTRQPRLEVVPLVQLPVASVAFNQKTVPVCLLLARWTNVWSSNARAFPTCWNGLCIWAAARARSWETLWRHQSKDHGEGVCRQTTRHHNWQHLAQSRWNTKALEAVSHWILKNDANLCKLMNCWTTKQPRSSTFRRCRACKNVKGIKNQSTQSFIHDMWLDFMNFWHQRCRTLIVETQTSHSWCSSALHWMVFYSSDQGKPMSSDQVRQVLHSSQDYQIDFKQFCSENNLAWASWTNMNKR